MSMWSVREQSLAAINGSLKRENEAMEQIFALTGKYAKRFRQYSVNDKDHERFANTCCHMLIKAHHFAHSAYSLFLDGLVVEAGASLRSLVEIAQWITYICEDPQRVEELLADKPKSVGEIAQRIKKTTPEEKTIQDIWHKMKNNYNKFSSHFSMREETLRPLVLPYDEGDLLYGMRLIFMPLWFIASVAQQCILLIDATDNVLAVEFNVCFKHFTNVFPTLDADLQDDPDSLSPTSGV